MFQDTTDLRLWNRTILNTAWVIVTLALMAVVVGVLFDYLIGVKDIQSLIYKRVISPFIWITMIMLFTEMIMWRSQRLVEYCIMGMATLVPAVFVVYFSHITTIHNVMFLSTLVAAFYFEKYRVYLSCVLNMIVFILLFNYNHNLKMRLDGHDLIVTLLVFLSCLILSLGIMSRGKHLLIQLKNTLEEQQKLMISNIAMDRLTKVDALTDLYNHKTFHEYLDRLIDESERTGLRLYLAMIDIDNFKEINDKFGHHVGDIVLSRLAEGLSVCVSPNDFVSRYGGEEFAIIFVDQSSEEVLACLENIRIYMSVMHIEEMNGQAVTISGGLKVYSKGTDKQVLFRNADECLYEAKRTGKNKILSSLA